MGVSFGRCCVAGEGVLLDAQAASISVAIAKTVRCAMGPERRVNKRIPLECSERAWM